MYVYIHIYIYIYKHRKTESIHHHHPEGVVYRSVCLNSGTVAVSNITSRRWWCIESVFPNELCHSYPYPCPSQSVEYL